MQKKEAAPPKHVGGILGQIRKSADGNGGKAVINRPPAAVNAAILYK
jgi:hypothetical protein